MCVPVLCILIANIVIIATLTSMRITRVGEQYRHANSTTYQVMCISVVTLIFRIMLSAVYVQPISAINTYKYTFILMELFGCVNSGMNVIFYCYFGTQFRRMFLKLFCRRGELEVTSISGHTRRSRRQARVYPIG